jgi:putative FmdB family regulatory protein
MPIYEYQCQDCGHRLEVLQKISDAPLTICPKCEKARLSKLVSAASFQLKGTGWYATDFRNRNKEKKEDTKSNTDEAKPTSNKDDKESTTPPSTGTETKSGSNDGEAA